MKQTISTPCPHCGREENGQWFVPCPSDDCPSNKTERLFVVTLKWRVEVTAASEDDAIAKASRELKGVMRGSDYAPFDCWTANEKENDG